MKYIFTLLIVFIFAFASFSQTFSVANDKVDGLANPEGSSFYVTTYIKVKDNISSDSILLRWVRAEQNISSGWQAGVCDNNLCYLNEDSATFSPVASGDSVSLKIQFFNGGNEGTGDVTIFLYDINDKRSNGTQIEFTSETWKTNIDESPAQQFNIFPNPAKNYLMLDNPSGVEANISIYDVLGKKVKHLTIYENSVRLNIADFRTGMYILTYENQKGELERKTFSKE